MHLQHKSCVYPHQTYAPYVRPIPSDPYVRIHLIGQSCPICGHTMGATPWGCAWGTGVGGCAVVATPWGYALGTVHCGLALARGGYAPDVRSVGCPICPLWVALGWPWGKGTKRTVPVTVPSVPVRGTG